MPRVLSLIAVLVCVSLTQADDWPQWLGPTRDAVTTEKIVPWKTDPKVLWREPVGEGNSSPIVANGLVFVHAKVKDKLEEEVIARDAKTGKEVWRKSYERAKFDSFYGNGPRATPAVADGKLYTIGITGILTCWNAADGKQLWQIDTLKTFEAKNLRFGVSCSPLVESKGVLINVGGKGASVVNFAQKDGEVLWKSQDDAASYSSPIAVGKGKERQVVFLTGLGVISLNSGDGALNWRYPLKDGMFEASSTPALAGDILLASSITFGTVGLKMEEKESKPAISEAWKNEKLTSYFSTPVTVGEQFYLVTSNLSFPKIQDTTSDLNCLDAKTGKVLWKQPKVGKFHASLIRTANDKLLMLDDFGNLILLEPNEKEYKELARSKVAGETWAHAALSNGRLFVRDDKEVICLQIAE